MDSVIEIFADCRCELGEGPVWDENQAMLYWVDITGGSILRKKSGGNPSDFEKFDLNIGMIGGITLTHDGFILAFAEEGYVWKWYPGQKPALFTQLAQANKTRFNDVIAGPRGDVFCGVAPNAKHNIPGSLRRMDENGKFNRIEPHLDGMPNGMGFSPDLTRLYFTISNEKIIYRYDYDSKTGNIINRTPLIEVPETEGLPDGMTVDNEGAIWSAQWNGSKIVRYSPQGDKLTEIHFNVEKITSVAFGGPEYADLFVTTSNKPWDQQAFTNHHAGSVFTLKPPVGGKAEFLTKTTV